MASATAVHWNVTGESADAPATGAMICGAACVEQLSAGATVKVRVAETASSHPAARFATTNQPNVPLGTAPVSVVFAVVPRLSGEPFETRNNSYETALTELHENVTGAVRPVAPSAGAMSDGGAIAQA